jgi:predicted RNA-binding Zn-ribbon protein involved in translation (DUF1610 family)
MLTVTCDCGAKLNFRDELLGKKGKCPKCGQIIDLMEGKVELDQVAVEPKVTPPEKKGDAKVCPGCGARIPMLSFSCEFCGAVVDKKDAATATGNPSANASSELGVTPEELVDRFVVAIGKVRGLNAKENEHAQLCQSILSKMRIYAIKDSALRGLVNDLQRDYDRAIAESVSVTKKDNKISLIVIMVIVVLFAALALARKFGCYDPR